MSDTIVTKDITTNTKLDIASTNPKSTPSSKRIVKKTAGGKKKKKNICYMDNCSNEALKFIGDCNFCHGHYCSKHRIMENHKCTGLESCKEQMHKKNAEKLNKEQTIIPKIQI